MDTETLFDDFLDETYEEYSIAGVSLLPSQILKETDPIAYRVALSDFESYLTQDEEN